MTSASVLTDGGVTVLLNSQVIAAASPARKYVHTARVAGNAKSAFEVPVRLSPTLVRAEPALCSRAPSKVLLLIPIATANRPPRPPASAVAICTSSGLGLDGV